MIRKWKIGNRMYRRSNGTAYWNYTILYGELDDVMNHIEMNLAMGITKVSIELMKED